MADLVEEIVNLNENSVIAIIKDRLAKKENENPMDVMADVKIAMKKIGDLFAKSEYFLPDLIMSGEILRQIFELIGPKIKELKTDEEEKKGKVLLGTVEGDIHDIGKDIVKFMLDANGFDVLDLGVDVPAAVFVKNMKSYNPDVVALSGFLTIAFEAMKETIEKIKEAGLRDSVRIMIGGGTIDERIKEYVGADAFGDSAVEAVNLVSQWLEV
jgi:5-methyltetrahydrofolate--homocysteine methyltransferase